jgi:hypothetical protein
MFAVSGYCGYGVIAQKPEGELCANLSRSPLWLLGTENIVDLVPPYLTTLRVARVRSLNIAWDSVPTRLLRGCFHWELSNR